VHGSTRCRQVRLYVVCKNKNNVCLFCVYVCKIDDTLVLQAAVYDNYSDHVKEEGDFEPVPSITVKRIHLSVTGKKASS
jgi:hypothetical protein